MGISKIKPGLYIIKARQKGKGRDARRQERFLGNLSQAQDRYLALKAELRGDPPAAGTFGDLLRAYRQGRVEIPRGQRSIYESLERDLGPVELKDLAGKLERYSVLLRRLVSRKTGAALSNGSINRRRAMVACALSLAVEKGVLAKSPLTKAVWPKLEEVPRDRFLEPLEAQRLLNVLEARAPHLLPMVRFALLVPCRKAELVKMTRKDLDLFHSAIRVRNAGSKGKTGSWKPIPAELVAYFRALPADCPWLFYRKSRKGFRPLGDFKRAWRGALREAGLEDLRFHDTRHIAATGLADAGTPERAIMDIAGWRTNMLSTYYKSSSKKALGLVRFPSGSGNLGATLTEDGRKTGVDGAERAVS